MPRRFGRRDTIRNRLGEVRVEVVRTADARVRRERARGEVVRDLARERPQFANSFMRPAPVGSNVIPSRGAQLPSNV